VWGVNVQLRVPEIQLARPLRNSPRGRAERQQRPIIFFSNGYETWLWDGLSYASAEEMRQYRLKVERFIHDHSNHITINKLRMNRQITRQDLEELERLLFASEEVGSCERFEKVFGYQQRLGMFIRKLVGLDRQAASEAFGEFLHNAAYSATQIRFIDQIISYLTRNGAMDPGLLYEAPFTDLHNEGLDGVFGDDGATRIVHLLQEIEMRAAA
jgi:type I restriction enzyme, R subunit